MKGTKMPPVIAEKAAVIQKICPLPSELSFITKNIPCPEEGCKGTFLNSSNLEMHLSKRHRKRSDSNKKDTVNKSNCQYHCPVEKCLYNINSDRYFSHIKYLKQHYLKVHAEKKYLCNRCDKGFSTEAARNVHVRTCGMTFTCSCGCTYFSYEALSTHAKRKNHTFDANLKLCAKGQAPPPNVLPVVNSESVSTLSSVNTGISCTSAGGGSLTIIGNSKESPYILVNATGKSLTGLPLNMQPLSTLLPASAPASKPPGIEVGVQTERSFGCRRSSGGSLANRRITPKSARSNASAGTQTQGNNILKRAMRAAQIPVNEAEGKHTKNQSVGESGRLPGTGGRKRKKSMETQTVVSSSQSNSVNPVGSGNMQEKRLIENVYSANPNEDGVNAANHGLNFVQLPTQNSYQVPVTVPWIAVYPKCNSGTQTNPLSVKTICHPVVTQTDLSGIFLQGPLNDCQNQSIQCFTQLPEFEKSDAISSENITDDTNTDMLNMAGVMTNINFNNFSDNDYEVSNFDPMLSQEKTNSMEDADTHSESLAKSGGSPFQDAPSDLVDSISTACCMETQTEGEMDMYDSTLSHIETQTNNEDFLSGFDDLPLIDIHTQTCEEMLFSELGFSHIQTQTQEEICLWQSEGAANPLGNLVSIETQTAISGPCPTTSGTDNKDFPSHLWMSEMSHIETQTDMDDMRKLILELTKHDIEGD